MLDNSNVYSKNDFFTPTMNIEEGLVKTIETHRGYNESTSRAQSPEASIKKNRTFDV